MLRAAVWTLRQRRYAAIAVFMAVLAAVCVGAGTFELHRLHEKRTDNAALLANARATTAPLTPVLVPLTGRGAPPAVTAIRFRTVSVSGRYDLAGQRYVGNQAQGGRQGFWVLTPLRTVSGVLLVVRGFVAANSAGGPAAVPAPPAGAVRLAGRLQTAETGDADESSGLGRGEITSIVPTVEAARLRAPVYQTYLTLRAGQPGTAGLRALPAPSLGNPTGGASEWQLLSYVVQWYVFALLALLAPFLFARAEIREAQRRFLGVDPDAGEFDLDGRRLAALSGGDGSGGGGSLALRGSGAVALAGEVSPERRQRAARLADRYGLSLGPGSPPVTAASAAEERGPRRVLPDVPVEPATRTSATALHRSPDTYHGSYNDYLWQLALADGELAADGERLDGGDPTAPPAELPPPPPRRTIAGHVARPGERDADRR